MSFTDTTDKSRLDTISFELELPHPPAKVWRALTEPALLAEWLLPVLNLELDLSKGASFTLKTDPHPGWDGTVSCKLLEIEPQRKLSYTWTVPFLDTVVTFTLSPSAAGTRLSIEQSGFRPDQKQNAGGARYGWTMMGEKLFGLLARTP
jgi:uncharacterized protein YndB with AHSA1/START domain